jgi:hypothetical protein
MSEQADIMTNRTGPCKPDVQENSRTAAAHTEGNDRAPVAEIREEEFLRVRNFGLHRRLGDWWP